MADTKISALTAATTPLAGTEVLPIVQSGTTTKVSVANLTAGRSIATNDVVASGELVTTTNNARISMYRSTGTNYFDWASGQTLAFGTQTSQGGAGRVNKINFTDAGDIQIATAAKGVNFTANTPAAGMTSQLLNWYEEGTWTPVLTTDGVNFTSVSYNAITSGTYTRTGRTVTFSFTLFTTSVTVGSASGNVCISGLPFTSKAYPAPNGGGIVTVTGSWAVDNPFSVDVQPGDTKMILTKRATANGASSAMAVADVATGAGNLLRVTGSYQV